MKLKHNADQFLVLLFILAVGFFGNAQTRKFHPLDNP